MYPYQSNDEGFTFQTEHGFHYEAYFVASPFYFPENGLFKHHVFELVVKFVGNQKLLPPKIDYNIPPTIAAIFFDFFRNNENIVVFSCDTTDNKQAARHRKFNDWYLRFNDDTFLKYDGVVEDPENSATYFMSLIIKSDNPFKEAILVAFSELTDALTDGK